MKYLRKRSQLTNNFDVDQSTFANLSSNRGGAIYCDSPILLRINHCLFTACYASDRGGGIFCDKNDFYMRNTCFLSNGAVFDADSQSYTSVNLNYEYISTANSLTKYHSFWTKADVYMKMRYINSSFSKNTLLNDQYGSFMTICVCKNHSMKYLQGSNCSGLNSLFAVESEHPATVEYVNLLYDQSSPNIFGSQWQTSYNNVFRYFYVFGNTNIKKVFAQCDSSSTLYLYYCTFDLSESLFTSGTHNSCKFSNSNNNNFHIYTQRKMIICEEVIQLDRIITLFFCHYTNLHFILGLIYIILE